MTLEYRIIVFDNCNRANHNGIYLSLEFLSDSFLLALALTSNFGKKELQYNFKSVVVSSTETALLRIAGKRKYVS